MVSLKTQNIRLNLKKFGMLLIWGITSLLCLPETWANNFYYWDANKEQTVAITTSNQKIRAESLVLFWKSDSSFKPPFRYRIETIQPGWSNWDNSTAAIFETIGKGTYLFEVQDINQHTRSFNFHVTKPFPRSLYWIVGASTIVALIFFLLTRKYKTKNNRPLPPTENPAPAALSKNTKQPKTNKYNRATVLFADIQGFTKIVEHMNPEELIDELDKYFIYFDELVEHFQIEKIKTIGDAYMCAGGIPEKNRTNPIDVIVAAMAMQAYVKAHQHRNGNDEYSFWELRIGVHTGSVISGMIGHKKRYFDIWGDTVNIASRMESSGIAGEINITGVTYQMVKDFFVCEYRGKMPIKYKGETDMYFVKHIQPHLSEEGKGEIPNKLFQTRLQLIRIDDLSDYLKETLEGEYLTAKSGWFKSHLLQVEMLSRMERLSDEEFLLTKTAALLLFRRSITGEINNTIAEQHQAILARFSYHQTQINTIHTWITRMLKKESPVTLSEKILLDAHCGYLFNKNAPDLIRRLYNDCCTLNANLTWEEWIFMQRKKLQQKLFLTPSAQRLAEIDTKTTLEVLQYLQINPPKNS